MGYCSCHINWLAGFLPSTVSQEDLENFVALRIIGLWAKFAMRMLVLLAPVLSKRILVMIFASKFACEYLCIYIYIIFILIYFGSSYLGSEVSICVFSAETAERYLGKLWAPSNSGLITSTLDANVSGGDLADAISKACKIDNDNEGCHKAFIGDESKDLDEDEAAVRSSIASRQKYAAGREGRVLFYADELHQIVKAAKKGDEDTIVIPYRPDKSIWWKIVNSEK